MKRTNKTTNAKRGAKATTTSTTKTIVHPRPSRAILVLLGASFVVPLGILLVLLAADVRLGQGYFAYRWSPVRNLRTPRALPAVVIGAAAAGAVVLLCRRERKQRVLGMTTLAASLAASGAWIWFAPPAYVNQQMFNMTSPSSDGAFAVEANQVTSLPQYLRDFPQRLKLTPEQMGGTRVLSNPPLTTALAYAVRGDAAPGERDGATRSTTSATGGATADAPPARPPTAMERWLVAEHDLLPEHAAEVAYALRVSILLCVIWVLSGGAAYLLGRLFLSPAGAAVFAVLVTFNPCTLNFVPGKDPAQLLTINLMLWAWLAGVTRRRVWLSMLGGAILVVGATAGLVHIWVAAIAVAAAIWQHGWRRIGFLMTHVGAAAVGAIAVIAIAYLAIGWNIPLTLLAVSRRWGEIQQTFEMSRATWLFIGLPIFLLFLSPGFWTLAGLSVRRRIGARRRRFNFGTRLAVCTAAVMLLIYVVMGVTYELPRLWVAFLPPLALGLAVDQPLLRGRGEHRRVGLALATIVIVQVAFSAMHWTLFDAREAEYRLTPREGEQAPRFYH